MRRFLFQATAAARALMFMLLVTLVMVGAGCDDSAEETAPADATVDSTVPAPAPGETALTPPEETTEQAIDSTPPQGATAIEPAPEPEPAAPATAPAQTPTQAPATAPTTAPADQGSAQADVGDMQPYTETIPGSLVEFEMVPVPGGDGVEPFYMGKYEVTWDEFAYWAFVEDIDQEIQKITLRARDLRPSPPYDEIDRGFGLKNRPAIGMSLKSAQMYAEWLSEKTGRTYRLPTREEWEHAFTLGYGDLKQQFDETRLEQLAWFANNADQQTHAPGSKQPNELGMYDMLGNVAEWVTNTGEDRIVLGGHFRARAAEVSGTSQEIEDWTWNENYPNEPKSIWWFVDADYIGFRLVAEPENK